MSEETATETTETVPTETETPKAKRAPRKAKADPKAKAKKARRPSIGEEAFRLFSRKTRTTEADFAKLLDSRGSIGTRSPEALRYHFSWYRARVAAGAFSPDGKPVVIPGYVPGARTPKAPAKAKAPRKARAPKAPEAPAEATEAA